MGKKNKRKSSALNSAQQGSQANNQTQNPTSRAGRPQKPLPDYISQIMIYDQKTNTCVKFAQQERIFVKKEY